MNSLAPILYMTFIVSIVSLSLFRAKIATIHEQFIGFQVPLVMTDTIAFIPHQEQQSIMPPSALSMPSQMQLYQQQLRQQQLYQQQLWQQQQQQQQLYQQQLRQKQLLDQDLNRPLKPIKPITEKQQPGQTAGGGLPETNEPLRVTKQFQPPPLPAGTKLVLKLSEEFTGTSLDANKWIVHQGDGSDFGMKGWGNEELQCYNADNLEIDPKEGLVITAKLSNGGCVNAKNNSPSDVKITSGKIVSKKGFMWGGKAGGDTTPILVSARIKVPMAKSSFPAFWLLPMDDKMPWCSGCGKYGGWCSSGEIDIMEHINDELATHSTIFYGGSLQVTYENCDKKRMDHKLPENNAPDKWHIYSVLWDAENITTFVDGTPVLRMKAGEWNTPKDPNNKYAPFDNEMRIILNLAVGGKWPFSFAPKEALPAALPYKMMVDYVYVHDVVKE